MPLEAQTRCKERKHGLLEAQFRELGRRNRHQEQISDAVPATWGI
jgi:hypothetical protein